RNPTDYFGLARTGPSASNWKWGIPSSHHLAFVHWRLRPGGEWLIASSSEPRQQRLPGSAARESLHFRLGVVSSRNLAMDLHRHQLEANTISAARGGRFSYRRGYGSRYGLVGSVP